MKKSIYCIAILLVITMAISCKKDSEVSIAGFWTGNATEDGSSTPIPISILFNSNNSAKAYFLSADTAIAAKGTGSYSIDADSVRTIVVFSSTTLIFTGKLNSSNNQMNGRLRNPSTSSGNFSLTKN